MQAQNILKVATNKMPSYQKWGFPIPILTYSRKQTCYCRTTVYGLCAFFMDCLQLTLEDAKIFFLHHLNHSNTYIHILKIVSN